MSELISSEILNRIPPQIYGKIEAAVLLKAFIQLIEYPNSRKKKPEEIIRGPPHGILSEKF